MHLLLRREERRLRRMRKDDRRDYRLAGPERRREKGSNQKIEREVGEEKLRRVVGSGSQPALNTGPSARMQVRLLCFPPDVTKGLNPRGAEGPTGRCPKGRVDRRSNGCGSIPPFLSSLEVSGKWFPTSLENSTVRKDAGSTPVTSARL